VGSTFLPLAKSAVSALKRWQQYLSKREMDQLLKCIMPHLDLLLRTKGLILILNILFYNFMIPHCLISIL